MPTGYDQPAYAQGLASASDASEHASQYMVLSVSASWTACIAGFGDTGFLVHTRPGVPDVHAPLGAALLHLCTERPRADGASLQLRAVQSCIFFQGAGAHDGEVDAGCQNLPSTYAVLCFGRKC